LHSAIGGRGKATPLTANAAALGQHAVLTLPET
jgi:hypothetical protein